MLARGTLKGVEINSVRQIRAVIPVCVEQEVSLSCSNLLTVLILVPGLGVARAKIASCAIGFSLDASAALRNGFCC